MVNMTAKPADKATQILNTYDLIAFRTDQEALAEQGFTRSDADIISIDLSKRLSFFLQKTWIKLAIQRGVQFEVTYGSSLENAECRKYFMQNTMQLVKLTKGKNIIFASESSSQIYQRSPADVLAIANMLGITNQQDALATVRENCARAFQHAHHRKTFKGVAEIVAVQASQEETKMDLS
jgi:ribonuclease P/MRP protein subunit RPP1